MNKTEHSMQAYYAQRASEYDRIYLKPERQADLRQLEAWLPQMLAGRKILEVAAGTGYWSQFVAPVAEFMVITDGAQETLEIAQSRVIGPVLFQQADAYALTPELGQFNAALAAFWFSHVSVSRRREFLLSLHARLLPGSTVILMDNRYVEGSSTPIAEHDADGNTYQQRVLDNGSIHRVMKNFPEEDELKRMIEGLGATARYRQYGYFWTFQYQSI